MEDRICYYMAQINMGDSHQILNVSMLMILGRIYDKVVVCAPHDCIEDMKEQMEELDAATLSKIEFRCNKVYSKSQFLFWGGCGLQTLLSLLKTHRGEDVFVSTVNWLCFPLFNVWCAFTKRRMFSLCHSDLEHLLNPKFGKVNVHWHMIRYIFNKMSFAKNNYLLVLGDSIKQRLGEILSQRLVENHVLSICHPYYTNENTMVAPRRHDNVKIGIVGTVKAADMEGLALMDSVLANYPNVRLYNISTTNSDISQFHQVTNLNQGNKHIPRKEYDKIIEGMDMLFFPYPSTAYQVSASGAVYEAIMKGKPILAASNLYFEWLFQKFGKMGFLFHHRQELDDFIRSCVDGETLSGFESQMKTAKEYVNPKSYYQELNRIINNIDK